MSDSLFNNVVNAVIPDLPRQRVSINKDAGFVKGGFCNDTGLTGRKIIVDTYGGLAPHGGGAFSGKDPSKVDRSAAYMARYVAKNIVANGYADECIISVAYEFGAESPVMLSAITDNPSNRKAILAIVKSFDFRPEAIIERLSLRRIKYLPTSVYCHFTNPKYPWEQIIKLNI